MICAKVELTQALRQQRQFVALTGSGHHLLLDDAAGGTGPKPIELVAAGLAGCTAFDVITVLRQKYHQKVTGTKFGSRPIRRTAHRKCLRLCGFTTWSRATRL